MKYELRKADWKDKLRTFGIPRRLWALKVMENSMSPTVRMGDVVLCDYPVTFKVDDIVFIAHPFMQSVKIFKRVCEISADGNLKLTSDNMDEALTVEL